MPTSGAYSSYSVYRYTTKSHFLKDMDLARCLLPSRSNSRTDRRDRFVGTKVLGTIGPACQDVNSLSEIITAGASGLRIDLTWGTLKYHQTSLENLQQAMRSARKLCAVIVDTVGRELMIRRAITMQEDGWPKHSESLEFQAGQTVVISSRPGLQDANRTSEGHFLLPITSARFSSVVIAKDRLYIGRYLANGAEGSLYLEVVEVAGPDVRCIALNDAVLDGLLTVFIAERTAHQLTKIPIGLPLLSDFDKECLLKLSRQYEIDYITLSYTHSWQDVREAREYLNSIGMEATRILAKLETRESLFNFSSILDEADGVILSRGNLGLDCEPEKITLVQKIIIQNCNLVGKPVFITRVVDTMVQNSRPTRAEATDVANAVLDGVDGILLGSETLRGLHPVTTVRTVVKICGEAEQVFDHEQHYEHLMQSAVQAQEALRQKEMTTVGTPISPPDSMPSRTPSVRDLEPHGVDGSGRGPSSPPGRRLGLAPVAPSARPPRPPGPSADGPSMPSRPTPAAPHAIGRGAGVPSSDEACQINGLKTVGSHCDMRACLQAMTRLSGFSSDNFVPGGVGPSDSSSDMIPEAMDAGNPYMSKLESIASSAVKVADKVNAKLILVFTHTPTAAQLVAKYRPVAPIMVLVVPRLVSDGLHWSLQGRSYARQCALVHGVIPLLAAPVPSADAALDEAISAASGMRLVLPGDYVVAVERLHDDFSVKVVRVDQWGQRVEGSIPVPHQRLESCVVSLALPPMSAAALAEHRANGEMTRQASSRPDDLDWISGMLQRMQA